MKICERIFLSLIFKIFLNKQINSTKNQKKPFVIYCNTNYDKYI